MSEGQRSLPEAWRAIDRLEADRDKYVRRDVYVAERDADRSRIKRIEDDDSSKTSSARTWLYGVALMLLGAACGTIAQLLTARGHG